MKRKKDNKTEDQYAEIISKYDLSKSICHKLINLLDLITLSVKIFNRDKYRIALSDHQNISDKFSGNLTRGSQIWTTSSLSNKILIPLSRLNTIECGYKEVEHLEEISRLFEESPFIIQNRDQFDITQRSQSYNLVEDYVKARENLVISVFSYYSDTELRTFLNELVKIAPETGGVIDLEFGPNGLSRRLGEKILNYPIDKESDRYILLLSAIKGPKKSKEIKLKGKKTHSMVRIGLNKAVNKYLKLLDNVDLVVNNNRNGYKINDNKYKITVI